MEATYKVATINKNGIDEQITCTRLSSCAYCYNAAKCRNVEEVTRFYPND